MREHRKNMTAEQLDVVADDWGRMARNLAIIDPPEAQYARDERAQAQQDAREKRQRG
ncbi:hypothetical protein [Streptomyces sp. NBC_00932]|uniref:hypothetical protein n=1 Tax=Streptomyces sp. NBC_00932 TaxID=2903690 RepID=UPI003862ECD6|nr:hypothetical protein OG221_27720 [Streptomyces sp. NBC_00932]